MRPINKGSKPIMKVTKYRDYYDVLKNRIGCYCSYCERPLPNSELPIEHVRPQSTNKEYTLCWNNLLLSCYTCNSHKDKCEQQLRNINDLNFGVYAFPHIYDTYHLITYPEPTYMPIFNENQDPIYKSKVDNLLKLLKIENIDNLTEEELLEENEISSKRIMSGQEAKELREDLNKDMSQEKIDGAIKKIKREIVKCGFWSIWMKYFEDIDEIKLMLLDFIHGTEKRYFQDEQTHKECEKDHIYNDIIGTLEHRLEYKIENKTIENEQEWLLKINDSINKRIQGLTQEEYNKIQSYITDLSFGK